MRTTKHFKVVKRHFDLNKSIFEDYITYSDIKTFDNLVDAQSFCENNVKNYCEDYHDELQIEQHFNEDTTIYVRETYTL